MRVVFLSSRDKLLLEGRFSRFFVGFDFRRFVKRVDVRVVEDAGVRLFILDRFFFGERDEMVFPLVLDDNGEILDRLSYVIVDRGAIPHIASGANVMRPGVREWGSFLRDDIVVVRDELHRKAIAVGKALVSSDELENMDRGVILKNMHHVDDKFWRLALKIK